MSVLRNTTLQHSVVLYTYHKSFKLSSTHAKFTHVGLKLSHGGAVFCWTVNATLRWITQNVLPAYNYPIQATGQDSCRVITMVTPTKTYILQQCTATTQTETSVQETDPTTSAEIVIGQFNTLHLPRWLHWIVAQSLNFIKVAVCYTESLTLLCYQTVHITF